MGNLLACFGAPENERRRKTCNRSLPTEAGCGRHLIAQRSPVRKQLPVVADPKQLPALQVDACHTAAAHPVPEPILGDRTEPLILSSPKKKVTFDLNVKTYEDPPLDGDKQDLDTLEEVILSSNHLGSFPSSHRYQSCINSDDDIIDDDDDDDDQYATDDIEEEFEDCGLNSDRNAYASIDRGNQEEESYESFFSLQMDKDLQIHEDVSSRKRNTVSSPGHKSAVLQGKQSSARDRSNNVHSVLNPVENLYQWKERKEKEIPVKNPRKEKIMSDEVKIASSPEPSIKLQGPQESFDFGQTLKSSKKREVSVDTSLSSWLTPPKPIPKHGNQEKTSGRSKSSTSLDDRPILGALTVEDIKHSMSASPSPRKSPSKSPDEMPILGTVGSYWNHTNQTGDSCFSHSDSVTKGIPNTTSKYREDKQVNWHSTPFEVRLERALNRESPCAYAGCSPAVC